MNKRLSDAISRLNELPEDRQEAVAALLLDYLDQEEPDIELTPEQIAEIEAAMNDNDFATDEEVEAFFAQLKK